MDGSDCGRNGMDWIFLVKDTSVARMFMITLAKGFLGLMVYQT